jgi:hypothetical protein
MECFCCSRCSTPFTELNFREVDKKIYCKTCDLQDICPGCEKAIGISGYLVALEKKWHKDCLLCHVCKKPVQEFVEEDGHPFCRRCITNVKTEQATKVS